MCPNFSVYSGIDPWFYVEKFNKDEAVWESGWFHNLILDIGLDFIGTRGLRNIVDTMNIGTGSSEPSKSQTGLDNYYMYTGTSTSMNDPDDSDETLNPVVADVDGSATFGIGNFSGQNITELGLSNNENDEYFNRQLIRQLVSVSGESVGTGDGSTKSFTHSSSSPVEPNTISITDGTQSITDDGVGNLIGDVSGETNVVDYDNGDYEWTFANAPDDGDSITIDYDWWESTSVTVLSDEGLKVYFKVKIFGWFGESSSYTVSGEFDFDDQVDGSVETIGYEVTYHGYDADPETYFGGFAPYYSYEYHEVEMYDENDSFIDVFELDPDNDISYTDVANGGPKAEITFNWEPPSYDGKIGNMEFHYEYEFGAGPMPKFWFDPAIDKREQDKIVLTFAIRWGRYYGTS